MTTYQWGDSVRVRVGAPTSARPGTLATVCSVLVIDTATVAAEFELSIGDVVYGIEFADGEFVEVPERVLEPTVGVRDP